VILPPEETFICRADGLIGMKLVRAGRAKLDQSGIAM
jgi:hypothetical protein